ncbi:MAG: hypothetical protein IGR92_11290 [Leptolyngbyaceae cyanobacterium T60_A2020_046]|nr:hypothetical protein [Leptolyngbyaceae cyanobacterium T60_A2020_046]
MLPADLMRRSGLATELDRDRVQLALAIADEGMVRSLLTDCQPAIARSHQIGHVRVEVGVPTADGANAIAGVLEYEHVSCVLTGGEPDAVKESVSAYQHLTRCQSELQTLAWRVNLSEAIALLRHGGFDESHIQRILQLPWDGWHRTWWDTFDAQGELGLPFQRWFRTRCYGDGTYTLQYRDHYAQDAPPCFRGVWRRVPLAIAAAEEGFGTLLTRLRAARQSLNAEQIVLLASTLTDLEQEGLMRQGVSLYLLRSPALSPVACTRCLHHACPMHGHADAPVLQCRNFQPAE